MRKVYIIGAAALLFGACKPSVNITNPPSPGSANFTNYLAIGDNYTAGYADNSLTVTGQLNSYPMRLFEQFQRAGGGGPFIQPLLTSDNGYPGPKKILGMTYNLCDSADSSMGPIDYPNFIKAAADDNYFESGVNNNQINNIGVYGLRVVDMPVKNWAVAALNSGAPYAYRFFRNRDVATPREELIARVSNLHPTFFSMWLGLNDVLGYAAKYGGQGDGTGFALPTTLNIFAQNAISNIDTFRKNYDSALRVALSEGAGGVLINIPDITEFPFFNTIPIDGLEMNRETEVDSAQNLANYYIRINFPSVTTTVVYGTGKNLFFIQDHNGLPRQAVPGEKILLTCPLDSLRCAGWGKTKPIPAQYVLTTDELTNVRNATTTFNSYIKQHAELNKLAYVDMNTYLKTLAAGFTYYGIHYSAEYVSGGAFSLDGIHFTPRGYALIANHIIAAINARYASTLPMVDVNKYHGIDFPTKK